MRYSEKEAFNGCPYRYKCTQDGLKKGVVGEESNALKWGQGVHAGLEAYYKGLPSPAMEEAFRGEYGSENLDPEDRARTFESGVAVIGMYVERYREQDKDWEVIGTEVEDEISIGGEEHGLHIDLLAKYRPTGEIYIWDHKTTAKEPSQTFWKTFELSGQVSRYTDYVVGKYGSCAGCLINAISVKHLKIKNKYGEGPGLVVKFERQMFNRSPQQLKFWRESDEAWMKMMEFAKREGVYPKALNGLCAWCEFYDLCLASGDEQIKELLYKKQEEFNPCVEGL